MKYLPQHEVTDAQRAVNRRVGDMVDSGELRGSVKAVALAHTVSTVADEYPDYGLWGIVGETIERVYFPTVAMTPTDELAALPSELIPTWDELGFMRKCAEAVIEQRAQGGTQ